MADRNAPGAIPVITQPDYEAMVIGAHPDDNDLEAGGTSALWAKQGKKIVWVVMTDGAEGSQVPSMDPKGLMLAREQEQRASCEVLGVQALEFLRFPDGHLQNSAETRKAVVRLLRSYRPRVVITHDPSLHIFAPDPEIMPSSFAYVNHRDHRATGNIVMDAIFPSAANPCSDRELLADGLQPYHVHEVYLYTSFQANTYIDIGSTLEQKARALQCHITQFGSEVDMLKRVKKGGSMFAKYAKEKKGLEMEYAEAFRRAKLYVPGVSREFDD